MQRVDIRNAIISTLLPLAAYWWTAAPGVTLVDSGEFVTVCAKLGVGHPPGVPTYVLLGHLFSLLPIGADIARRLNLFSSVCSAVSAGMSYLLVRALFYELESWAALAGALAFGFSMSLWSWAVVTEVYALNVALITAALYFAASRNWRMFALFGGLSLGVHHATAFLALVPAFFLILGRNGDGWKDKWLPLFFVAGLSTYFYLPIAANHHPVLNWGNPDNVGSFLWHVTGASYRGTDSTVVSRRGPGDNTSVFLEHYFRQLHPLAMAVALAGWSAMWRRRKGLFFLSISLVLLPFFFVLTTDFGGSDVPGYYLASFLTLAWCFALGVQFVSRFFQENRRGMVACSIVLAVSCAAINFPLNDHHDDRIASLLVENTLRDVPAGSLVITADWNFYAPWLAEHFVAGKYQGIDVVFTGLLVNRWYMEMVERDYPDLYRYAEHDYKAIKFIERMIQWKFDRGNSVFYTMKIERHFLPKVPVSPHGLLYQYGTEFKDVDLDVSGLLEVPEDDPIRLIKRNYAAMLSANAETLISAGARTTGLQEESARAKVALALRMVPGHPDATRIRALLGQQNPW